VADSVETAVNEVRANLGLEPLEGLSDETSLRGDLGFDSLAMAELTVRIEAATGVDVFADGIVATLGEIRGRLPSQDE